MKKNLLLLALGCCLSSSSFAAGTIDSKDKAAARLLSALNGAGVYTDCGAGTCGTEAVNVQCLMHGNATGNRSYECTLTAQNETGSMSQLAIKDKVGRALYRAIQGAGIVSDCGAGTCGVEAKAIQCLMRGNSTGRRSFECSITPQ